ncbi:type II toxin-antitoxin system RelB/DinJ family antitoxin [uncultured Selenomonas sp.]|uniref:type II toxin-antitoxin system RelB/DinJ family antitoxin n=1 Tax=uncultured Selenomonas sp. TaxID=159275 RepID=UPI0025E0E67B|nr:type II toxin-antitoxin system RelB/DinJ family antitoxin [uncultured Selenomonas sp.]
MAATTADISIQMDADLKAEAEAFFHELGMSLSTAINVFVRQSLREGRIPFEITTQENPNEETIAAMLETERMANDPNAKVYHDLDELFADLDAE